MSERNFDEWLAGFRKSIATYDYYVDFQKVYANAEKYKKEFFLLNSLIGSKNIKEEFIKLIEEYPKVIECLPILIAYRETEIYINDNGKFIEFNFSKYNQTPERYAEFMDKIGLFDLMKNHIINNIYDYVLGVEVGLDSNGRKNRGGHLMEDVVESYLQKSGYVKDRDYFKELYLEEVEEKWNVDLSALSNNGGTAKRFDFVLKTPNMIYVIETNFYQSQGSKLNETARSYKTLALETQKVEGVTFVWFTDGQGWKTAKGNLKETFDCLSTMYNLNDLDTGIIDTLK